MIPMIWIRYALLVLILPAYVIALTRRRWTTIPLWLVSASVVMTQIALRAQQSTLLADGTTASAFIYAAETTKIMVIPIAVQLAVTLKGMEQSVGNQLNKGLSRLVQVFDAGER